MLSADCTVSARFPTVGQRSDVEISVAVRLEIPGEPGVDVAIALDYEPKFPLATQDVLHQRLYDGVHGGLAAVERPLPPGGVTAVVTAVRLTPPPDGGGSVADLAHTGRLLQVLTAQAVSTLFDGLLTTAEASL